MKPIIMSTEDVRVILDNRKTMARLVAKELDGVDILNCRHVDGDIQEPKGYPIGHVSLTERCKFKPGDVLWVREPWNNMCHGCEDCSHTGYQYKADGQPASCIYDKAWCSPIFMPRQAARLFLRVKDVRVERVQDITVDDAGREGFEGFHHKNPMLGNMPEIVWNFQNEWDARNAKRGYGWDANPYVWVIEFERTPSGAIGPEPDRTAPNGDKGAGE